MTFLSFDGEKTFIVVCFFIKRKGRCDDMIAVYVNEQGVTALLGEKGVVRIYDKVGHDWQVIREYPFEMEQNQSLSGIRRYLQEMVQKLEGCKVFVAKAVAGQLYYLLEAHGFESFEAEGVPETFLNSVHEAVQQEKKSNAEKKPSPEEYFNTTEEVGVYVVNLKKVLNLDCSLTSKKLLLPFFRKKEFNRVEVFCDHVPRWFETDLPPLQLHSTIVKLNDNEYSVHIMPI